MFDRDETIDGLDSYDHLLLMVADDDGLRD